MAHMLGEEDMDNNADVDMELQFTFQLNPPGTTLNGDNNHYPNGHDQFHRNGFLPSVGHPGQNGHVVNSRRT